MCEVGSGQHHQIQPLKFLLMTAETLTNDTLNAIAAAGPRYFAAGDGQPQTRPLQAVIPRQHQQQIIR